MSGLTRDILSDELQSTTERVPYDRSRGGEANQADASMETGAFITKAFTDDISIPGDNAQAVKRNQSYLEVKASDDGMEIALNVCKVLIQD